jgi:hypothetical protein
MDWIDVIMCAIVLAQTLTLKTLNVAMVLGWFFVLKATFCHGHDGAL